MSLEMSKEKKAFVGEYLKKARPWEYLPKMHLYEDKVLLELDFGLQHYRHLVLLKWQMVYYSVTSKPEMVITIH